MTDEQKLPPLFSDSGTDPVLRDILGAAAQHEPSAQQLANLASRLGTALPPGSLPGCPAGGAEAPLVVANGASAVGAKIVAAIAVVGISSGSLWLATRSPVAPSSSVASVQSSVAPQTSLVDEPLLAPSASSAPSSSSARPSFTRAAVPSASSAPVPSESEASMLARAHEQLLHGSPSSALSIVQETAKAYPRGILGQERELITIESLFRMGRVSDARARAEAFRKAYPRSSHLARLDSMLGLDSPSPAVSH